MTEQHVLAAELSHGLPKLGGGPRKPARAVIERGKLGAVFIVEQLIGDEWHGTGGRWYLETLLRDRVGDSLAIDYGQGWYVYGLQNAITEACRYLAGLHSDPSE